ncbi:MAG: hypothetical protein ACD_62C00239G0003 [uncultured bacterium]|nr:MAG: hypothetical protein ACD_62C00239G0003 [uncultured bacterium]HLD44455.1 hypothetical protein [bacterium]
MLLQRDKKQDPIDAAKVRIEAESVLEMVLLVIKSETQNQTQRSLPEESRLKGLTEDLKSAVTGGDTCKMKESIMAIDHFMASCGEQIKQDIESALPRKKIS